ncbi:MAG: hypothetical protein EOP13_06285 [Pseudomonas sp.]|uniref:hypothetical protein n=1 Tax=Pseudomonas sp. TaxID=306 RepID=UPI001223ED50|nr:hypothetical protein [Pseudomonas sp.]RZI75178.1 MAG: hypothetical protein EOP13_06285 [Pseudomonas sp.]
MATQKSTQAAPAASVNDCASSSTNSSSAAYKHALVLLDEVYEDQETILCIAVAAANNANEDAVCEMRLFNVIRKMTESVVTLNALRAQIATLAQHAGLAVEVQS